MPGYHGAEDRLSAAVFAPGRDGGVDITETRLSGCHMVQVKHYIDSSYSTLLSSLKKELPKVKQKQPKYYYVCCGKKLTAQNISEIYELFRIIWTMRKRLWI